MKNIKDLSSTSIEEWAMLLEPNIRTKFHTLPEEINKNLVILMIHTRDIDAKEDIETVASGNTMESLIYSRIQAMHTYTVTPTGLLLLAMISNSPGVAVMYINWLQYMCHKNGISVVDSPVLMNFLAGGVFDEDTLHRAWDMQKYMDGNTSLNILDNPEYAESIKIK